MKRSIFYTLLILVLNSASLFSEAPEPQASTDVPETLNILSFNIQIFGKSKMAKPEVVSVLSAIVSQYDVIAVQEVRSADPAPVEEFMATLPAGYAYALGPREGRSSSKEQYWFIYDASKVSLAESGSYPDPGDRFEREPFAARFVSVRQPVAHSDTFSKSQPAFDFVLVNIHTKPADAGAEIDALDEAAEYFGSLWNESDLVITGDFNADGSYFDESGLAALFPAQNWTLLIGDSVDTTVAASANTYDRMIISRSAGEDWTGNSGVYRFDEAFDFGTMTIQPHQVSDHYPVWAEFRVDRDTD
jgi:hypothetical protein